MRIYEKSLAWFGVNNPIRDELDNNWLNIKNALLSDNFLERWIIHKLLEQLNLSGKFDDYHIQKLNDNLPTIVKKWSDIIGGFTEI